MANIWNRTFMCDLYFCGHGYKNSVTAACSLLAWIATNSVLVTENIALDGRSLIVAIVQQFEDSDLARDSVG